MPTGVVTFFDGAKVLGTAIVYNNGQAALFLYGGLPKGKHILTAVYSGDDNFQGSTSDPFIVIV